MRYENENNVNSGGVLLPFPESEAGRIQQRMAWRDFDEKVDNLFTAKMYRSWNENESPPLLQMLINLCRLTFRKRQRELHNAVTKNG